MTNKDSFLFIINVFIVSGVFFSALEINVEYCWMQHVDLKIKELSIKPEIRTSEFDVCSQKVRRTFPTLISFMRIVEGFFFFQELIC